MILINFSHPTTADQHAQIETLTGQPIDRTIEHPAQFDTAEAFAPQVAELVASVGLNAAEWQTEPLLLILPSLNFGAAALLAELHGRCGYFPPIVRIRPVPDSLPPKFEVAEIIDLQAVRDEARRARIA